MGDGATDDAVNDRHLFFEDGSDHDKVGDEIHDSFSEVFDLMTNQNAAQHPLNATKFRLRLRRVGSNGDLEFSGVNCHWYFLGLGVSGCFHTLVLSDVFSHFRNIRPLRPEHRLFREFPWGNAEIPCSANEEIGDKVVWVFF